jgi:cell division transport system permease protein
MKLMGANRSFVRKPYIRQGLINGLLASVIALILISLTVIYALREFGMSAFQIKPYIALSVSAIVILSGITVTVLSSRIAVGRYLRMKTEDIYFA